MARKNAGKTFNLNDDGEILQINSPMSRIEGNPYVVVLKDVNERWCIVALKWDNQHQLGIRWFWDNSGFPQTNGIATWTVLPNNLSRIVLRGATGLSQTRIKFVEDFLDGRIDGITLKNEFNNKGV